MLEATLQRLAARVPGLVGRLRGAAEFSALVASNDIRQVQAGAYVLAMSLAGGQARAATGAFVQEVEEGLSVILTQRAEDPLGGTGRDWIITQRDAVIAALAGWVPTGAPGPMRLKRGQMLNVARGLLVYQLDLAVASQLRIDPR
ncbi:phage tail terminator protein [Pararhodobacter zhoushanensis]|uniref:SCP2 domain-containing protein n=1 Tax=Pararhodobacter zhoushanensis TaxID=2479545 RepID=A0ABT3H2W0_9RHOB|nr:hypothetical protein [Pararhodobacter zhoushanensis]MCW1934119.1 hypothetical protein [Pararhodobacter zhoushanensis]